MSSQTSRKRCHLCQSEGDHFTPKCPKIVCANCSITGHAKKDCPNLLQPPNPKINDFKQRVSNLVEILSKLEKLQRILLELSKDSKYEDKLQLIPKNWKELNHLQSQLHQMKEFSSDFEIEAYNHKIALSENTISHLRNWIHFDTFQSGSFANLNLRLVEPDRYFGFSENVKIKVKVESWLDLKRVGIVSLDGLLKTITLTSDFYNLLPDNVTFINVTVRENCQCIKLTDALQYLKAVIPIQESVTYPSQSIPALMDIPIQESVTYSSQSIPALMDIPIPEPNLCQTNYFSNESCQNDHLNLLTKQKENLNQVGAKVPVNHEDNKTENMENKEKFEQLSQDFQNLNAKRLHNLKTLVTLKKVCLQKCSTFKSCFEKVAKMNQLVNPLKSLLQSETNGYVDDKVIMILEELFEAFKTYTLEFSKDFATIRGNFRTYEHLECVGEDKFFPPQGQVIDVPVHIAHKLNGVKTVGIITTKAFPPEEIIFRNKHIYILLPNNQVLLTFRVGIGGDELLYSNVVKCLRAIVPKK